MRTSDQNPTSKMESQRAEGVLLGLACGDALGRPVEFMSESRIQRQHGRVTEMLGMGTYSQPPGTVTDDSELAQRIAESLVESGEFDPADVASRFIEWYDSDPLDVGIMTSNAISRLKRGESWESAGVTVWESREEGSNAGNGSVMRCAPYAIAFADQPEVLERVSRHSSQITHADPRCTYGCAILNRTIAGYLRGDSTPLATALSALAYDAPTELVNSLEPVPSGISPDALRSTGYVVDTLQTALYHGLTASSPKEAICNAVNMGKDTDTVGAVTGAIVGARFGAGQLPDSWLRQVSVESRFRELARELDRATYETPTVD
jgi:ADP-ribosyl-[dinitrogen reductase] hydrolase